MEMFQFQYPLTMIEDDTKMIHEVLERWNMSCEIEIKEHAALITAISTDPVNPDKLVRLGMVLGVNTSKITLKRNGL